MDIAYVCTPEFKKENSNFETEQYPQFFSLVLAMSSINVEKLSTTEIWTIFPFIGSRNNYSSMLANYVNLNIKRKRCPSSLIKLVVKKVFCLNALYTQRIFIISLLNLLPESYQCFSIIHVAIALRPVYSPPKLKANQQGNLLKFYLLLRMRKHIFYFYFTTAVILERKQVSFSENIKILLS